MLVYRCIQVYTSINIAFAFTLLIPTTIRARQLTVANVAECVCRWAVCRANMHFGVIMNQYATYNISWVNSKPMRLRMCERFSKHTQIDFFFCPFSNFDILEFDGKRWGLHILRRVRQSNQQWIQIHCREKRFRWRQLLVRISESKLFVIISLALCG